jgi:hypothetical protein
MRFLAKVVGLYYNSLTKALQAVFNLKDANDINGWR